MTDGPMKNWTVATTQTWIKSLNFSPSDITNAVSGCATNSVNGVKLLTLSRDATKLAAAFGVYQGSALGFCTEIKRRKREDINRTVITNTPNVGLPEFHLNVFYKSKRIKLNTAVNVETTIESVKKLLHDQEIAPVTNNDAEMKRKLRGLVLLSGGTVLDDNNTLNYYNITSDNNLITVRGIAAGGNWEDDG